MIKVFDCFELSHFENNPKDYLYSSGTTLIARTHEQVGEELNPEFLRHQRREFPEIALRLAKAYRPTGGNDAKYIEEVSYPNSIFIIFHFLLSEEYRMGCL